MLIAVHRAQQRIDKEKMKFENQYQKAVFKDSSNHNLREFQDSIYLKCRIQ